MDWHLNIDDARLNLASASLHRPLMLPGNTHTGHDNSIGIL
jgi:hypothetical protein